MAACEVRGELKYRDGQTKEFVVKAENNLKSVLAGVQKISADVSEVLTELVLQEKGTAENGKGDFDGGDEEDDDSDEEEEDNSKAKQTATSAEPPAKRSKTLKS
ncbi:uncharacterized protein si:dkeyp-55f12.3 [Megalops cyprinoides]|uniref:uncharacterized protein si:dkeyp-55f12.3 n=1 Tax=Megalops cyprinoides TaxID=118141 RepID=UPI0018647A9C|nr:uncharacterized protein si:dkeyp-55f12.3 [Megalops cyprinoides]